MNQLHYYQGGGYILARPFQQQTRITEACAGDHLIGLSGSGMLTLAAGYCWNGVSGPMATDHTTARGSLVHDSLYDLIQRFGLSAHWRDEADLLMCELFEEDGLNPFAAAAAYQAVRKWGASHADPRSVRPVLVAPLPLDQRVAPEVQAP